MSQIEMIKSLSGSKPTPLSKLLERQEQSLGEVSRSSAKLAKTLEAHQERLPAQVATGVAAELHRFAPEAERLNQEARGLRVTLVTGDKILTKAQELLDSASGVKEPLDLVNEVAAKISGIQERLETAGRELEAKALKAADLSIWKRLAASLIGGMIGGALTAAAQAIMERIG